MPLSAPAPREHIHTRRVTCQGFRRADGLWDIEGHLTDIKTYGFHTEERGRLDPGTPIHQMWMRLTVDDALTVTAVEAVTDDSPYHACPGITPRYQQLVGLRIGAGWTRAVKDRLGGPKGCTHLVELLGPLATTAFQTVYPILAREAADRAAEQARISGHPAPADGKRPALLNMCHIFDSNGPVVRRHWPAYYTGDAAAEDEAFQDKASQDKAAD